MSEFSRRLFFDELKKRQTTTNRRVIIHRIINSTSTDLMNKTRDGAGAGTIVVADTQTAGRGRRGNSWFSNDNESLYISIVVEVKGNPAEALPMVPLVAGVSTIRALGECGFTEATLKWPNDILSNGKKLAGILCEVPTLNADPLLAVVGLGINLGKRTLPSKETGNAISMASFSDIVMPKESVAAAWIANLERRTGDMRSLVNEWRNMAEPFGRKVKIGKIIGTTVDLNDIGQLMIRQETGDIVSVPGGVIEYVK